MLTMNEDSKVHLNDKIASTNRSENIASMFYHYSEENERRGERETAPDVNTAVYVRNMRNSVLNGGSHVLVLLFDNYLMD